MGEVATAVPELDLLKSRVDRLEEDVLSLRRDAVIRPRGSRIQKSDKAEIRAVMARVMAELGIPDEEPQITAEELQERMIRNGIDPNECIASRAIVAEREKTRP